MGSNPAWRMKLQRGSNGGYNGAEGPVIVLPPSSSRDGGISTGDPLNPMRLAREPSYDTDKQSREILGIGVVTASPKINRVS